MNMRSSLIALCLSTCLTLGSSESIAASLEDTIIDLQRQIDAMKAQQQAQQREVDDLRAQLQVQRRQVDEVPQVAQVYDDAPMSLTAGPKVTFGGQYRVNAYTADNGFDNPAPNEDDNQTASRFRLRQNVDVDFGEQLKTHIQFELHHTTDNVTTTDQRRGGESTEVSVRHAVMDYTFRPDNVFKDTHVQVGLVPLQDYFSQTQFSSDWDYNPLAASFIVPAGGNRLRLFAGNLEEGSESNVNDDFVHYQADLDVPLGSDAGIYLTGTALNIADADGNGDSWHYNYGISGFMLLGDNLRANGFVMGSSSDGSLLGGNDDADGVAVLAQLTGSLSSGRFGLLASYASGEDDGTGFLMPMAFAQSYGYWGYTGILTVQGPTDTGFDGDAVNMSNNGYGMSSIQARYDFPVTEALTAYISAGWYGNTDAANRASNVGTDFLAMGTYRFNRYFVLDAGMAYARLKDSVSGYFQGVQSTTGNSGAGFNQARGEERDKYALFTRIQAEF
ncbi:MAG: hypothetical protein GWP63_06190 [Haliea sp.]|jgi:hypothetical protein|nr:hypothetical protein [Haliea sp.]